jgi:hypothetical protein
MGAGVKTMPTCQAAAKILFVEFSTKSFEEAGFSTACTPASINKAGHSGQTHSVSARMMCVARQEKHTGKYCDSTEGKILLYHCEAQTGR